MLPVKMTAAILESIGDPLVVKELDIPELTVGQVLVKVKYSGVCRSQIMEIDGGRGVDKWLPHLLGHEGSGTVLSVGEGVTKLKPGDDVILGWVKGDGIDGEGAKYVSNGKVINSGKVTTFSNYSIVSESRLVLKPPTLPFDVAVLYGCALPTGAGMVINELKPSQDAFVVVLGLGGIGLASLMALKALGIKSILAADVDDKKLEFAKNLGATSTLSTNDKEFQDKVFRLSGGGADLCIESCGYTSTIELGFSLIRKGGGKLIFASHPSDGEMIRLSPHELISGKKIYGSWGGGTSPDSDIPIMHALFESANIPLNAMFTKRYSLLNINEAIDDLRCSRVFRPLISMTHNGS